jgi:hypothetical protein
MEQLEKRSCDKRDNNCGFASFERLESYFVTDKKGGEGLAEAKSVKITVSYRSTSRQLQLQHLDF